MRPVLHAARSLFHPRLRIGPPRGADFLPVGVPGGQSLRIGVVGDVGTGGPEVRRTAAAMARTAFDRAFDALVLLGDNVYPHGDPARLEAAVFDPFAAVLGGGARLLAVLGNHDVENGNGEAQAHRLGMPGRWYAARLGPVLFLGLDSNQPDHPAQRSWLRATLAATSAPWKIAALHHPPYSAGKHRSELSARQAFCPAFERFGVQLVLSGHEHDYQRSKPLRGSTYVVSGGAARVRPTAKADFTDAAFSTHHFTDIHLFADHLLLRAVDQQGRVFDEVFLPRR